MRLCPWRRVAGSSRTTNRTGTVDARGGTGCANLRGVKLVIPFGLLFALACGSTPPGPDAAARDAEHEQRDDGRMRG